MKLQILTLLTISSMAIGVPQPQFGGALKTTNTQFLFPAEFLTAGQNSDKSSAQALKPLQFGDRLTPRKRNIDGTAFESNDEESDLLENESIELKSQFFPNPNLGIPGIQRNRGPPIIPPSGFSWRPNLIPFLGPPIPPRQPPIIPPISVSGGFDANSNNTLQNSETNNKNATEDNQEIITITNDILMNSTWPQNDNDSNDTQFNILPPEINIGWGIDLPDINDDNEDTNTIIVLDDNRRFPNDDPWNFGKSGNRVPIWGAENPAWNISSTTLTINPNPNNFLPPTIVIEPSDRGTITDITGNPADDININFNAPVWPIDLTNQENDPNNLNNNVPIFNNGIFDPGNKNFDNNRNENELIKTPEKDQKRKENTTPDPCSDYIKYFSSPSSTCDDISQGPADVDYEELKCLQERARVQIIDVRIKEEVEKDGRLPWSIIIPLDEIEMAFKLTENAFRMKYCAPKPKIGGKRIIFSSFNGEKAREAWNIVAPLGYCDSRVYFGSFEDWKQKGGALFRYFSATDCMQT